MYAFLILVFFSFPSSRGDAERPRLLQERPAGQGWTRPLHQTRQEEHQAERRGRRRSGRIKVRNIKDKIIILPEQSAR